MLWQSLLGLFCFPFLAWLFSENRQAVSPRLIITGLGLQLGLAVLLLYLPWFRELFFLLNHAVLALDAATQAGTTFVFGYLGGAPLPFPQTETGSSFILAFRAMPLLLVVSALTSLLFYWHILPLVVRGFSLMLEKLMGIGGALGLAAAANVFVGMTEAPLFVRLYLHQLSRSELFALMVCGMATIAGTVMVIYAKILQPVLPEVMGHLLTASLISAPAALMIAQLMIPETATVTLGKTLPSSSAHSVMDAITQGTLDGLRLLLNILALLIVFVALVNLFNQILALFPTVNGELLSLQRLLGWIMAPVAWLLGIPWAEAQTAGMLLGTKTVLNEFIAYLQLAQLRETALSEQSRLILIYALCGFANFGSLGIMIGGLSTLVPARREEIVALGLKSIVAGTLATYMTGAIVGILIS